MARGQALTPRISGVLQGAWQLYWARKRRRATVLVLRALDDRALKDIGMDRSEIESLVYGGLGHSVTTPGRLIGYGRRLPSV